MAMIGRRAFLRVVQFADGGRGLKAVHFRHLHVHQHHVEILLLEQIQGLPAVLGDLDRVPAISQHVKDELLVGRGVFGQQHAQRAAGDGQDARGLPAPPGRPCPALRCALAIALNKADRETGFSRQGVFSSRHDRGNFAGRWPRA